MTDSSATAAPPLDPELASRRGCGCGSWIFVVVPAVIVGLLVAAVAIGARSDSDDEDGPGAQIEGPAAELPAVSSALTALVGDVAPPADRARALGARAGEIGRGLVDIGDDVEFAGQFDRLPAESAELLGESLGAVQRELSPDALGGPRRDGNRIEDMVFALEVVWAAAPVLDPTAEPQVQALNVLPAAVPLAETGDEIVAAVVAGDMESAAVLLDPVLSEAGAVEVVSGLAGDISDRVGELNDDDRLDAFREAYNLELP